MKLARAQRIFEILYDVTTSTRIDNYCILRVFDVPSSSCPETRRHRRPCRFGRWILSLSLLRPIILWTVISWPESTDNTNYYYYYCHYNGDTHTQKKREVVRTFRNPFYAINAVNSRCHYHHRNKNLSSKSADGVELMIYTVSLPPTLVHFGNRQQIPVWF